MKSGEANAAAERQLVAETGWLVKAARTEWVARNDGTGFDPVPALVRSELATRIKEILCHPELVPLLGLIEQHNSQPREIPGRRLPRKDHFLIAPHLFHILASVEARNEMRQKLPVLDRPAAEVRDHLQNVAADCRSLADLIRRGPPPHVALAGETNANDALQVFAPWTELFEASVGSEHQNVPLAALLERGADWFDRLAERIPRARQNRHTGNGALRIRAAEFLVGVFLKRLGHPYHAHVATITTIVSGIPTNADFVKKSRLDSASRVTGGALGTHCPGKRAKLSPDRALLRRAALPHRYLEGVGQCLIKLETGGCGPLRRRSTSRSQKALWRNGAWPGSAQSSSELALGSLSIKWKRSKASLPRGVPAAPATDYGLSRADPRQPGRGLDHRGAGRALRQ